MQKRVIVFTILMFLFHMNLWGYVPEDIEYMSYETKKESKDSQESQNSDKEITNSIGIKFVLVEKGTFKMGSDSGDSDEKPIHTVNITKDFYVGKYEVTKEEWAKFINATNYKTDSERGGGCYIYTSKWEKKEGYYWNRVGFSQSNSHPVACVSHNDTKAFINWLNAKEGTNKYRLLTEAEWEYVARGGNKSKGYEYSGTNIETDLSKYANFCDVNCKVSWKDKNQNDGYENTAPVGSFKPNELGIYDMSGNVYEWVQDRYDSNYYSKSIANNPSNSSGSSFVLRGGSWFNYSKFCRVAYRINNSPAFSNFYIGFRLAKTL